jgi:hypothetical protein
MDRKNYIRAPRINYWSSSGVLTAGVYKEMGEDGKRG